MNSSSAQDKGRKRERNPPLPKMINSSSARICSEKRIKRNPLKTNSFCQICAEKKRLIPLHACSHTFCSDCITKQVSTKIGENAPVVPCLSFKCTGSINLDSCRSWISPDLASRWEEAICKSTIPESQKHYCPFPNCSVLLIDDCDGKEPIKQAECPSCHRLFCAQCRVPFHGGMECDEFQKLDKDAADQMLIDLAAIKKWRRCPNCRFFVEKKAGCQHIICRCGFQFCYGCGATPDHSPNCGY